ncbi:MAG: hypothetical protein HY716_07070 [Planctomycetes bacterium]|nr:hypothetical protein [Planctomycetota bacterium]
MALALRGLAGDAVAPIEPKLLHASAAELEAVARRLDTTREHLCRSCKVREVEEKVRIGGKQGRPTRAAGELDGIAKRLDGVRGRLFQHPQSISIG